MYCNCKTISVKNYKSKFHPTKVDSEGVCLDCGYYAVFNILEEQERVRHGNAIKLDSCDKPRLVSKWHHLDAFFHESLDKAIAKRNRDLKNKAQRRNFTQGFRKKLCDKLVYSTFPVKRWALYLKIPENTLRHWYTEFDVKERRKEIIRSKVAHLSKKGLTQGNIAKSLNIGISTVGRYQKESFHVAGK